MPAASSCGSSASKRSAGSRHSDVGRSKVNFRSMKRRGASGGRPLWVLLLADRRVGGDDRRDAVGLPPLDLARERGDRVVAADVDAERVGREHLLGPGVRGGLRARVERPSALIEELLRVLVTE